MTNFQKETLINYLNHLIDNNVPFILTGIESDTVYKNRITTLSNNIHDYELSKITKTIHEQFPFSEMTVWGGWRNWQTRWS